MRHGRKSRSKRFDGYKEHIARDLDLPVIVACAVTPANRPEEEGAAPIAKDIQHQGLRLVELHIERAYVNSPVVDDVIRDDGQVFSKPWGQRARRPDMFSKRDFKIDVRAKTITCPAGQVEVFEPGDTVEFDPEECGACPRPHRGAQRTQRALHRRQEKPVRPPARSSDPESRVCPAADAGGGVTYWNKTVFNVIGALERLSFGLGTRRQLGLIGCALCWVCTLLAERESARRAAPSSGFCLNAKGVDGAEDGCSRRAGTNLWRRDRLPDRWLAPWPGKPAGPSAGRRLG
ncbi:MULTISPECIES: hypothetical protein [Sorangium]|uniref:hypothetical protein n=1 Tax=Sorangium TaxID=39643 RepID=UPI003D9C4B13